MSEPQRLEGAEFIALVPAIRRPPDRATLLRIARFNAIVQRPLTADEVLMCLTPEGLA